MTNRTFPQANKTFTAPPGMENCLAMDVWQGRYFNDDVLVSCWQPTDDEVARILVGEPVYLLTVGRGTPPVSLFAGLGVAKQVFNSPQQDG